MSHAGATLSMGIEPETLRQIVGNGFRHAFLQPGEIAHHLVELGRAWDRLHPG